MNGQDRRRYNKFYTDVIGHLSKVEKTVERVETTVRERWNAHSERSYEIDKKIDKLFEKFDGLPCKERKWIPKAIYTLYAVVITLVYYIMRAYFLGN